MCSEVLGNVSVKVEHMRCLDEAKAITGRVWDEECNGSTVSRIAKEKVQTKDNKDIVSAIADLCG